MTENEIDAILQDAVATYRVPAETPRADMWSAIDAARAAAAVVPITQRPRWVSRLSYAAGIAAILVVGIAIGRTSRAPAVTARVAPVVAETTVVAQASVPVSATNAPETEPVVAPRLRRIPTSTAGSRVVADNGTDDRAYRFAVLQHLARTEILLTSFDAQTRSADDRKLDAHFASTTRDLLGTTRLMLTHRNNDPTMSRLLEDLELVLMQISQYATDGRRVDLDAANQSIDKRNVINKLRSSVSSGT